MQRKALKQLGKVTQWTNEKMFSGEKTQLSNDFTQFEKGVDIKKDGIERLHATSEPFCNQITKRKTTADPYPPPGTGKDKITIGEALGQVMVDFGDALEGSLGDGLTKYGRARTKMAMEQEEFGNRLSDGYMSGLTMALETVNEYKGMRKKLDSRRLALDAAITRLNGNKKGDPMALEMEVENARARFEEIEEETIMRGEAISSLEENQFIGLTDLLDAELEYFAKCTEILQDLKSSWPSGGNSSTSSANRPRAKSSASAKSFSRGNTRGYSRQSAPTSDEEEATPNRSRSQSNASSTGKSDKRKSILPSFGSFGRRTSALANVTLAPKKKGSRSEARGESRMALPSDDDEPQDYEDDGETLYTGSKNGHGNGRNRSHSTVSTSKTSLASIPASPPVMRRTYTAPAPSKSGVRYVKAKHDFAGTAHDELPLRVGQIVEVRSEVNDDWWVGESEGSSGIFPSTYCEEYFYPAESSRQNAPPPMPRRNLPPSSTSNGQGGTTVSPSSYSARDPALYASSASTSRNQAQTQAHDWSQGSESEFDSQGYDDADHYATAALAYAAQPAPTSRGTTPQPHLPPPIMTRKKSAPPPPPSRRSQSSSNILSIGSSPSSYLPPPQPAYARPRANTSLQASPEASPFGGSEDELDYPTIASPAERALRNGMGEMSLGNGNYRGSQ